MATKIERIQDLLSQVEEDTRKAAVKDILIDLAEFAKDADAATRPGLLEAIQMIRSNY